MRWILLLCILAQSVAAELVWDQQAVSVTVHPVQAQARAVFQLNNKGVDPVVVEELKSTCGCLTAEPGKRVFSAGEKGSLSVLFDLRNRTGKHVQTMLVKTSDGATYKLEVEVVIPAAYGAQPHVLKWASQDATREKTVRLVNKSTIPIEFGSLKITGPKVQATLSMVRAGFEYEIRVQRPKVGQKTYTLIEVIPAPPNGLKSVKSVKSTKIYLFSE